jgi:RimJ/RimL family protein N-acetyltransferase
MTLAHGTDRLESARLMLRRIAPDDLGFFTRIHALPEVTRYLYPGGRPRSPEESAMWLRSTLEGYEHLALGCLAVLRKEDGALIGRCGLTDLVVESVASEHGIRKGWFGRARAPAGGALTFECELSYTFDPAVWGVAPVLRDLGHSPAKRPLAARRRTVRPADRRPNGSGRSGV